jgi:hypothetical protein
VRPPCLGRGATFVHVPEIIVTLPRLAALWVAALLPFLAAAAGPADPAAPVPSPVYRSAFAGAGGGVEQDTVAWKKANADVAQFPRGHIDLLKWENGEGAAPAAAPPAPAASPTPRGHQHPE